jgi:UDP-glucose 4-epimerase
MMKLSGMQVDISAVNQQLLMQNLMIRANNYAGIQLDCTAGGTNTRVTRSMIRRVLAERFGDVQKLFITANDSDTADNTVDSYMR